MRAQFMCIRSPMCMGERERDGEGEGEGEKEGGNNKEAKCCFSQK